MRKLVFFSVLALITLTCALALAQEYTLAEIGATMDIPDEYITLTTDTLDTFEQWLTGRGRRLEDVKADFEKRGVLMQCWAQSFDSCFEITATKDDYTMNVFDVNEQSTSVRGRYRLSHYPRNEFASEGYEYSSSEWKNTANNGRFLVLRYINRQTGEIDHRGFARRTIRNGFQITLDMKVYGRQLTNKDNSNLNKLWDSFRFTAIFDMPPEAAAKINVETVPPKETNTASFTISGTAEPGVRFTAVVMGLSYPEPILFDAETNRAGNFKLPIRLPKEGVFMVTLTAEYEGHDAAEYAYPVTYQRTLLAVDIHTELPEETGENELTISGNATPGASMQIFVNGERTTKRVNTKGGFSVDIDTSKEGPYEIVLVFSKQGLADRRFVMTTTRKWTDADQLRQLASEAISPGYATLVKKIAGYDGRIMGYDAYVVSINKAGDDYILYMALTKRGDRYISQIIVTTSEEPKLNVGDRVRMYGTCVGMSVPADDAEDDTSYPCFDLLLFASLE